MGKGRNSSICVITRYVWIICIKSISLQSDVEILSAKVAKICIEFNSLPKYTSCY